MNGQDWTTIVWDKRGQKPDGISHKKHMANEARKGNVNTVAKTVSANQNKTLAPDKDQARKIADEEERFVHKTIGMKMGNKISQARCEKKLTREQLAQAMSLPKKIIEEFETGKAIYNGTLLTKIERFLNTKLRE